MKSFIFLLIAFSFLQFSCVREAPPPQPVSSTHSMVVSTSSYATEAGLNILKNGGNAVDAAVAVGFALAVTYPSAGNIGGGGFMVIHLADGKNVTIDYREKAPLSAYKDMYLDKEENFIPSLSQQGATSAGVPGSVAGLIYALKKYGTLPLTTVIQPAIELAKKGWRLNTRDARYFLEAVPIFEKYPSTKKIFIRNDGNTFKEGELFVQPDLARTLELIKEKGTDGFYKGIVAALLIKQVRSMGGYITMKDLSEYNPVEREPVTGTYRGYEIVSMPPPSSGGVALIEMLNILENYNLKKEGWNKSQYIHHLIEAMKYAYADRTYHLGDPDFYPVPVNDLTSKNYAKLIYKKIKTEKNKAVPSELIKSFEVSFLHESKQTTHYSVYDSYGNAVSITTTINSNFGSGVIVEGAGFFLNNEMDDFSSKAGTQNQFGLLGTEANSIQPRKRMLSSMTPTIVLKNGKPYIIIGSPGGSTIITTVLQVILNCIDFNMNIQQAINAPRIHHQWMPDSVFYEPKAFTTDVKQKLIGMGYKFVDEGVELRVLGIAEGILIDRRNNIIYGADDRRGGGLAKGL